MKKPFYLAAEGLVIPNWWASREKTLNFLSLLLPWLCSEEPTVLYEKIRKALNI
jgi:hypothetical protein